MTTSPDLAAAAARLASKRAAEPFPRGSLAAHLYPDGAPTTRPDGQTDHARCPDGAHDFSAPEGTPEQAHEGRVILCNHCQTLTFWCETTGAWHHAGADVDPCFLIGDDSTPLDVLDTRAPAVRAALDAEPWARAVGVSDLAVAAVLVGLDDAADAGTAAGDCVKCHRPVRLRQVGSVLGVPVMRPCAEPDGKTAPIDCPGGGYHEAAGDLPRVCAWCSVRAGGSTMERISDGPSVACRDTTACAARMEAAGHEPALD